MNNDVIITTNNKMYNKNKRQIYVWEENKEFYDSLPNKSKMINMLIKEYRSNNGKANKV